MTTRLFNAVLAISSVACAFTTLPHQSSNNAFAVRQSHHGPLHMSSRMGANSNNNDFPEELPEGPRVSSAPSSKFVTGDDLHKIREEVLGLRTELAGADPRKQLELQRGILKAQQMDAEFVYTVCLERMEAAEARGRFAEAEQWQAEAMEARAALPQFNLEGLWVGKYGEAGYEMINVTYIGDTMRAYKVTGDKNVPKGELSFSVDLSPKQHGDLLEPVELGDVAAHQWGAKYLTRFAGKGQVAGEGFVNSQFLEGQLILVNEFFSFAWVPIGHQVFFGRPSPELTLKLLKASEESSATSDIDQARAHLDRCLEETQNLLEEEDAAPTTKQDYYSTEGCFE